MTHLDAPAQRRGAGPATPGSATRKRRRRWERAAVAGLLAGTAVLYLWGLGDRGWANAYYAAAAQAGGESWTAWLLGGLDAGGAITVDKPPLSLWLPGLAVRGFGLSGWTVLVPQAVAGVAAVAVLRLAVRRAAGPAAGLLAGLALALSPAAALMFRYDNPDAMLTLLLVLAAAATARLVEGGRARAAAGRAAVAWAGVAGVLVGLGFLTKTLQVLLLVPALVLVVLVAAPGRVPRRAGLVAVAAGGALLAAGWWVALVELWPASRRPYVGGSADDSFVGVALGLNGASRLTGDDDEGPFGTGSSPFAGEPGPLRLLNYEFAGQVAWLLPLAAVALAAGLVLRRAAARTDGRRAAYLLWGGWAVVHLAVFSHAGGIVHPYYAVAAAPAVAALCGIGAVDLARLAARRRTAWPAAVAVLGSAAAAAICLRRAPGFVPPLPLALLAAAVLAAALLVLAPRHRWTSVAAAGLAAVAVLGGPLAWTAATVAAVETGGDPQPGPESGPAGSTPDDPAPDRALAAFLRARQGSATWAGAAVGAQNAAPLQLEARAPVVTLGGFDGTDPGPSLARVQDWAAGGELRYVVGGTAGFRGGVDARDAVSTAIVAWARDTGRVVPVPGSAATVYDVSG